ncbi:MAG: PKD domain-containing protein, partial [Vicinamibacteria bacterium]
FISSTGGAVALGATQGGISTGVVAGIAAGGAAAAGLGVLATGGDGATTTTASLTVPPPPPTTTAPATTTSTAPVPSGLKACFTLDPANGNIEVNESLRVDGRCSEGGDGLTFHYDLGDGRVKDGQAFMTAVWPAPGNYTLTLTVSRNSSSARAGQNLEEDSVSREIRVQEPPPPPPPPPELVVADFTARNAQPDLCVGEFDGSSSQGDIVRYLWALDLDNAFLQGVITKEGRVVVHDWKADCYRAQGNLRARLTVFGRSGSQSSVEKQVNILSFTSALLGRDGIESSFASEMLESKDARGQIVIEEGPSFAVSGEAPTWIRYGAKRGRRALEAVATAAGAAFLWRLDFTGAGGFVPGSLRTVGGQEVARDAYSVTLRFSGAAMERARIEYQLEP